MRVSDPPTTTWNRGDWMQTFTGRQFFPMAPRPQDVCAEDIAHALSQLCRYNGHTHRFYSVAEHCVLMSRAVEPEFKLWALLHDATEAYVGDMIRPLKNHMPDYRAAEDRVMEAIATRFGLDSAVMPDEVKDADNRILRNEREALMYQPPRPWSTDDLKPLDVTVFGWSPTVAKRNYLDTLKVLTS